MKQARRYWIQAHPQIREARVCWLEGLSPVATQPRHIVAWHGPYRSAEQANKALAVLYPVAGWSLTPVTEKGSSDVAA